MNRKFSDGNGDARSGGDARNSDAVHRICPVSGLPVKGRWEFSGPSGGYKFVLELLGDRILVIKAEGYVTGPDMVEARRFIEEVVIPVAAKGPGLVYIEDYTRVKGADLKARRLYIDFLLTCPHLIGMVIYGMRPIFKISYKLATMLHLFPLLHKLADDYAQALEFAGQIIAEHQQRETETTSGCTPGEAAVDCGRHNETSDDVSGPPPSTANKNRLTSRLKSLLGGRFSHGPKIEYSRHFYTRKQVENLAKDIVEYIAAIDWVEDGFHEYHPKVTRDNPLWPIREAITLLKAELDTLNRERQASHYAQDASESRYRSLVEQARAGIFGVNFSTGRFLNVNDFVIETTGYSRAELLDMNFLDLVTDDSKIKIERLANDLQAGDAQPSNFEIQFKTKKGDLRWGMLNAQCMIANDGAKGATMVVSDITSLKETESELRRYQAKLKSLTSELAMAEEKERRKIANYLHDFLGQELIATTMTLGSLEKRVVEPDQRETLASIRSRIRDLIQGIRKITIELSPPVLYELGFEAAVEWQVERFASEYGLDIQVVNDGLPKPLDEDVRTVLFRGLAELLTNVHRHAGASKVVVGIEKNGERISLTVGDDGVGFDPGKFEPRREGGFGLFNIKERLESFGGTLGIDSRIGQGTAIELLAPLRSEI